MPSISNSKYPNGFIDGITLRNLPILSTHPGNLFWVNNTSIIVPRGTGGSDTGDGSFRSPFSTIAGALAKTSVVASRGDIIAIMPGHAETISTATALTLSKAGVAIVGIGGGGLRPKFTLDTATTATINITANDVSFKNIVFAGAFADIVSCFTLTTAANFHLEDCEFVADAVNENFLSLVDTSTVDLDASGLSLLRCQWVEPDAATLSMLKIDADLACLQVENCYYNLGLNVAAPGLATVATGKDITDIQVRNNTFIRLNTSATLVISVDTTTANSGTFENNYIRHADIASEVLIEAGTNIGHFQNFATALVDLSGFLLPAADS